MTISEKSRAKLDRLSSALRLRLRFRSYIVLRLLGTRSPVEGGCDILDWPFSCVDGAFIVDIVVTDEGRWECFGAAITHECGGIRAVNPLLRQVLLRIILEEQMPPYNSIRTEVWQDVKIQRDWSLMLCCSFLEV
jgi:hypothetical protein